MRTLWKNQEGFTLVELLTALALLVIIASGLLSIYWSGTAAYNRDNKKSSVQYDTRVASDRINTDIRECIDLWEDKNAVPPVNNIEGGIQVQDATGTEVTSGPQLYLEKNEAVNNIDTDCKIIYKVDANKILHRQRNKFTTNAFIDSTAITENPVNITFTKLGNGFVKIDIEMLDDKGNKLYELVNRCQRRVD